MIVPVILSGGAGTRLWPLSRELYPKQLLPLLGQRTLIQQTVLRASQIQDAAAPIVVCNEEHRFLVAEQLRQLGLDGAGIILEPAGRNTAPALTLAALYSVKDGEDAVALVMPADHIIRDREAFHRAVREGAAWAEDGCWVTFGVPPTRAETGYGYLRTGVEFGARRDEGCDVYGLEAFVEKPDAETAEAYLRSDRYLWNSGIFMMRMSHWLAAIKAARPEIMACCQRAFTEGSQDGDFYRLAAEQFGQCPSESIDYAVMEGLPGTTEKVVTIPFQAGWSDVGAWSTLWEVVDKDEQGNALRGDVLTHDTADSLLMAHHRVVAGVGLRDILVIETADAVLVVHKDHAQDVKAIVERLKHERRTECLTHRRVYRPWGAYEGLDQGDRFQVKRILVKPGGALSLQMHHHRAEHWIVVRGTARVTRAEEVFLLSENQSAYIPVGTVHRLENPGRVPLEIIEVQSGSYLGEDDIVRFEDAYGRDLTGHVTELTPG